MLRFMAHVVAAATPFLSGELKELPRKGVGTPVHMRVRNAKNPERKTIKPAVAYDPQPLGPP